jgi:hypothetical protein
MRGGELGPNDVRNSFILLILYFTALLVVGIGFDRIRKNATGVSQETLTNAFIGIAVTLIVLVFAVGIQYINIATNAVSVFTIKLMLISFVILIFAGIVYYFKISSYILIAVYIMIAIVSLAIVFDKFHDVFERTIQTSRFKFVIQFIFYIPCLFNDVLRWGLRQINMTPYYIYVILAIELSLILIYFYLPVILNKTIIGGDSTAKVLQSEPFYINKGKEAAIANAAILKKQEPKKDESKKDDTKKDDILSNLENTYNRDYAFSMWINMNAQNISEGKEIVIFSYGYNDMDDKPHYKPRIVYKKSEDTTRPSVQNVYRVYFTEGDNNYYEIYVPNQRWNHFVLNYIDGRMAELWINGVMERVLNFGEKGNTTVSVPSYDATDLVTIGSKQASGTNAAICSVIYFYKSISPIKIVNLYNLGIDTKPYPGNYSL